jgi:hypothetical protein
VRPHVRGSNDKLIGLVVGAGLQQQDLQGRSRSRKTACYYIAGSTTCSNSCSDVGGSIMRAGVGGGGGGGAYIYRQ